MRHIHFIHLHYASQVGVDLAVGLTLYGKAPKSGGGGGVCGCFGGGAAATADDEEETGPSRSGPSNNDGSGT